jgi:hypothetical protein
MSATPSPPAKSPGSRERIGGPDLRRLTSGGGTRRFGVAGRHDPTAATVGFIALALGLVAAVAGGIVGQIGRAMQGRVI